MRILGLDLGEKRIGVAISDALRITAQGLDTIDRDDRPLLAKIIKDNDVSEIVVGLPLNMNGTKGEKAEDAALFADMIKREFSMPVELWDERLSSVSAEKEMIRGDLSRKKRKRLSDKIAAQLILQNYLDSRVK
ncbi:MAG: Holliday junction resolvase RuvX [Candidatus Omnitrophica bacterium]|nr:Holliday junction resolvase RuvX [Candidatus Omnitrophota bacterium]